MGLDAKDIAFQLSERDIPVMSISEATQSTNGIIQISPELQVHVSILDDFMNVVKLAPGGMLDFGKFTESLDEIEVEIKGLLAKPQNEALATASI